MGAQGWRPYVLAQSAVVVLGACLRADRVWQGAEILNGLMALPNLLALGLLLPEIIRLTREYAASLRRHPPEKTGILGPYEGRSGGNET